MVKLLNNPYYRAQALLARRAHSVFELRTKLKQRHFSPAEIDAVIAKFTQVGLLNDRDFAQAYGQQLLNLKPVGPRFISYKLQQKGVSESIINDTLDLLFPSGREAVLAGQAAERWRRANPAYAQDRNRLVRHLLSRGFSSYAMTSFLVDDRLESDA